MSELNWPRGILLTWELFPLILQLHKTVKWENLHAGIIVQFHNMHVKNALNSLKRPILPFGKEGMHWNCENNRLQKNPCLKLWSLSLSAMIYLCFCFCFFFLFLNLQQSDCLCSGLRILISQLQSYHFKLGIIFIQANIAFMMAKM